MRVALHSVVRAGQGEAYDTAHERIPDDLVESFARVGIHDWTIWRSADDLFHLVDCDDFERAMTELEDDPANQRWQATIGQVVDHFVTSATGPAGMVLPEVWQLTRQQGGARAAVAGPGAATAAADPGIWADLARPLPAWFDEAKFGIFIHWGPYSVPAWAEPSGALGAVPDDQWWIHNAYAEWYANTIRIPGSPAARHHADVYGGAPYDDFLDAWTASRFDPAAWVALFAEAGADHVIPTTKHHDGVTLWDAPGTGSRNTVHRGPRRDLVGALAEAVRSAGLRFGVYYSGGLDWSISAFGPHTRMEEVDAFRPNDAAYNAYAILHVRDLIERYRPDVLWNDINWPDSGKRTGAWSLHELFSDFYAGNPEGVVNDRWGDTHWDFRTSEYEHGLDNEQVGSWQNCRGIGFSFGYNQVEDESQSLSGFQLARHLSDVVSRGGRLLLNVGPTADGEIPEVQQRSLRSLGRWMAELGGFIRPARPVSAEVATLSNDPWVRWLDTPDHLVALVDRVGVTALPFAAGTADAGGAEVRAAEGSVRVEGDELRVEVTRLGDGPAAVLIPKR